VQVPNFNNYYSQIGPERIMEIEMATFLLQTKCKDSISIFFSHVAISGGRLATCLELEVKPARMATPAILDKKQAPILQS